MDNFEKNITFVIVCFRSDHIIEKCIKSINSNIKIIVVENSNNFHFKKHLESKFLNVEVIIAKENLGYGKANNLGISRVNTQYAFILNPDAILEKNCKPRRRQLESQASSSAFHFESACGTWPSHRRLPSSCKPGSPGCKSATPWPAKN